MKETSLPKGIRRSPPLQDGSFSYEARINRRGIKFSRRWPTVKEASTWKTRTDALIESGIDPRDLEENKPRERFDKATPHTVTPPLHLPGTHVQDIAPAPQLGMTVEEAIDGYIVHRQKSHLKLKPNQVALSA